MYDVPAVHPLSTPPPREPTRRWFLAGGVAALLGAAGGAIVELTRPRHTAMPLPPHPPPALRAAADVERRLIADLDATTGGSPPVHRVIVQARADHAAHLQVIEQLLAGFPQHRRRAVRHPRGTPRTLAQLRAAEHRAAATAARHASEMAGGYAALLASIAACETTHAELLR